MSRYFHGGFGGLRMGDLLLPPKQTGAASCADFGGDICRRDRVYITPNIQAAMMWASLHPSGEGRVYEVSPVGEVSDDPDCKEPGLSLECSMAKVLRTVHIPREALIRMRMILLQSEVSA